MFNRADLARSASVAPGMVLTYVLIADDARCQSPTGACDGVTKAWEEVLQSELVDEHGVEFSLGNGFTKQQRSDPLFAKVGDLVTFKYTGGKTSRGVPRHPSYLRHRQRI